VLDKSAPQSSTRTSGPLAGFRVVEFAGIGPGPFACMMLADMGAEVVTLDRVGANKNLKSVAGRGRKVVELDLKDKAAIAQVLDLLANADALIEGFRPGVMERLGLGPDVVLARNPRLVYGRMTGWGQEGPLAQAAGHDINYISVTGALAAIGTKDKPVPPLNLVGDFGGGALYLVVGVLAALLEASRSGKGQVVDAAMCDGAASLMSMFFDMAAVGRWTEQRESNFLDGGAHFYGVYECACGRFISIGSIEPQFYALLRQHAGLSDADFDRQMDRKAWPGLKEKLTESVRLHLVSDVPLGVFLSGGMDSSALVALMSRVTKDKPKTFSVVFDEAEFSEAPHSRLVAEQFQTDHHEIHLSEDQLLGTLPAALAAMDQPSLILTRNLTNTFLIGSNANRTFCKQYAKARRRRSISSRAFTPTSL